MIAHGYGYAAYGSPNLVFSNVLWGYVVRAIPSLNGVLGYSLATMVALLIFGWSTLYFLLRSGVAYLFGVLAILLLIGVPTLHPQFTMNAGLLTVSAILGWQLYARSGGIGILTLSCLLAFTGFLIRDMEFLLVLGVALPLLPWRTLRGNRPMQIAFLLLTIAIVSAAVFDQWSYRGSEWKTFKELNAVRVLFTDYGAEKYLRLHPEILNLYHYSSNDLALIKNWFLVDPQIANPSVLKAMLADLGTLPLQASLQLGTVGIKELARPVMLPLLLPALLFLAFAPRRPLILAWLICLAALFAIGFEGRPGILRVYIPLLSLLLIVSLMSVENGSPLPKWATSLILLMACIGSAYVLMPSALLTEQKIQQVQQDVRNLGTKPIISWADAFPDELAFPLLSDNTAVQKIKFYGLNAFTHAPFSVAYTEQMAGRGMMERLQSSEGIPIIVSAKRDTKRLRIYCIEHFNGKLFEKFIHTAPSFAIKQVRCMAGN